MRYSIDDSTGLLRTISRKVARPGLVSRIEDGIF